AGCGSGLFAGVHDHVVVRRVDAGRVGGGGVAGEHECLAAATAVVLFPHGAAAARFLHPVVAAEGVETGRVVPDPVKGVFRDVWQVQVGDDVRCQARLHGAVRGDAQQVR